MKTSAPVRPFRTVRPEGWGLRLRVAREAAGFNQPSFAVALGWKPTAQSRISQYECGEREPVLADFARMAKALNVSAAWLAFGVDK